MHRKRAVFAVLALAALAASTAVPAWASPAPVAARGGHPAPPVARAGRDLFSPLATAPDDTAQIRHAFGAALPRQSYFEGVSCASAAFCAAVGTSYSYRDASHLGTLAEIWNGTKWTVEPTRYRTGGSTRKFQAVSCTSASFCMAIGAYAFAATGVNRGFVEAWNGTAWAGQPIPQPPGSDTTDLWGVACTAPDACLVAGNDERGSLFSPVAWYWNGTTWSILAPLSPTKGKASSSFYGVSCTSAASCTATGDYLYGTDGFSAPFAEHWNGTSWSIQRMPNKPGSSGTALPGVTCTSPGTCVAAGSYTLAKIDLFRPLAEVRDGTSWKAGALSRPAHIWLGSLAGVSCTSPSACTAAGSYNTTTSPNGQLVPLYERWNGTAWSLQAPPEPGRGASVLMDGVSCPAANACTAAGYVHGGRGFQAVAEAWNGDRWTVQPTPN